MRAKNHDQRKGQWLINRITTTKDFPRFSNEDAERLGLDNCLDRIAKIVEIRIWNMENDVFDKLMEDYDK